MTRTPRLRFADHGERLASFADQVLVRCPSCAGRAVVERRLERGVRVICAQCGLLREPDPSGTAWQGPALLYARQRCAYCGRWLEHRRHVQQAAGAPQQIALACPGCHNATQVTPHVAPSDAGEPLDPHVGLPLWLQTPCCGHVLWAYNERHLAFLRDYVGATLRERLPRHNQSLASRLPHWLTRGHNRAAVLRGLRRLEQLLV